MNDSSAQIRFERWWTRGVLLFVCLFLAYFILSEREGISRLFTYILDAAGRIPQAIADLGAYYQTLTADQLIGSLLLGGVFGALTTLLVVVPARMGVELPPLPPMAYGIGAAGSLVAILLAQPVLLAVVVAIVLTWVSGYLLSAPVRHLLTRTLLAPLKSPAALRLMAVCAGVGFLVGALGAQLLTAATQHCTYLADAPFNEKQIGQAITLFSALIALVPLWTALRSGGASLYRSTAGYFRSPILPYVLLTPTLLSLILFLYAPSIQSITLSLKLRRFPLPQEAFVCLRNYTALAEDAVYRSSFLTTLGMTAAIVAASLAFSLMVAVLASQKVRGASIYRTLLIWPFALSPIVAGAIFLGMFRDGSSGLINALIAPLGLSFSWLRDANLAPWVIVAASVWNILGFNILFYIAGLQNVPKDLLEAAQIDGADRRQRFQLITIPLLAPYTFFLLVTNVTYSFYGVYGAIDALTVGGPPLGPAGSLGGATNALIYKLYQDGFAPGAPLGLASAQAVILFVMVAALTLLQFRVIETRITYGE